MPAILNLTTGIVFLTSWSGTVSGGSLTLTGVLKLADGTAAAPSLAFANDTATGLFTAAGYGQMFVSLSGVNSFALQSGAVGLPSGAVFGWSSTTNASGTKDLILQRDAANTLAQRNGVNAQNFNLYSTFTDASNYERLNIGWDAGNTRFLLVGGAAGTGSSRAVVVGTSSSSSGSLILQTAGVDKWLVNSSGHLLANTDNTYDIGASGANRPRHLIVGSNIVAGGVATIASDITTIGGNLIFGAQSQIQNIANGVLMLRNAAGSGFTRLILGTNDATANGFSFTNNGGTINVGTGDGSASVPLRIDALGIGAAFSAKFNISNAGKVTAVGNISTDSGSAVGVPVVVGGPTQRKVAATNAQTIGSYTVGAADGTFEVSANILVTTATTHSFTVTCAYTDEGNTARTTTLNFSTVAGVISNAAITNVAGAVPYEGVPLHIRCKASTTITIATTGTFTTVTYNGEGYIKQQG